VTEHLTTAGSELPTPPWTRAPQRPPRRRRDPLSQATIVDAALEVLDADGLELLSMRHVARTLDTTAAALYWHVGSKDGLLDLVFDRVIGEQPVPDPDPDPGHWQDQLKDVARTMRATILRHRDIVRLSIGRVPLGPQALGYADRVLGILRAGGVPDGLAVAGHQLLISIVLGFAIDETGEGGQPPAGQPSPEDAAAMTRDYLASLPSDRFPHLVELADHLTTGDADQRFELLLDLFVDGLAARARSTAT
jgi:AcrR family transcriptional regulator